MFLARAGGSWGLGYEEQSELRIRKLVCALRSVNAEEKRLQKEQIQWLPGTNLTAGQLMEWHAGRCILSIYPGGFCWSTNRGPILQKRCGCF